MNVALHLEKVYKNRFLRTKNEILEFETALEKLLVLNDVSIVSELCRSFEDGTDHHEVMFGLVHGIEFLYQDKIVEGLRLIALAVPKIISYAREWVEVLHYRILNDPEVRMIYGDVLSMIDDQTKEVVIRFLIEIKEECGGKIATSVDEVIRV